MNTSEPPVSGSEVPTIPGTSAVTAKPRRCRRRGSVPSVAARSNPQPALLSCRWPSQGSERLGRSLGAAPQARDSALETRRAGFQLSWKRGVGAPGRQRLRVSGPPLLSDLGSLARGDVAPQPRHVLQPSPCGQFSLMDTESQRKASSAPGALGGGGKDPPGSPEQDFSAHSPCP